MDFEVLENCISGEWKKGGGREFSRMNPCCHKELIGLGNEASLDDVLGAITAAGLAYDEWRLTPLPRREECFFRLLALLGDPEDLDNEEIDRLAELIARECGKPKNEGRADVVEGIHMLRVCAGYGRKPMGEHVPSEFPDKLCYTERVPRGITAVITPWNFPFAIPWWTIGPAVMMGNTVVFKPAEQAPSVGQRLVKLCAKAGFPPGVINLVHGGGEVGRALVKDSRVRSVLFTGSYNVGREIKQICAQDYELDKIAVLETGSKSGLIILDDADLTLASEATFKSAFKTTGQRCVSAGRVFVPRALLKSFVYLLMRDIESNVRAGNPLDPSTFMGPLVDLDGVRKVEYYRDLVRGHGKGVSVLMQGHTDVSVGCFANPFVYVLDKYDPTLKTMREEVFGPHLAIIPVEDADEAVYCFEDAPFNLSLAVHTKSIPRWYEIFRKMRHKGLFYVNLPTIGAEVQLPFGGTRRSGTGMASAADMFNHVSHPVAVTINMSSQIRLAQGLK